MTTKETKPDFSKPLTPEKNGPLDGPIEYDNAESFAWVSGFNSARDTYEAERQKLLPRLWESRRVLRELPHARNCKLNDQSRTPFGEEARKRYFAEHICTCGKDALLADLDIILNNH